MSGLRWEESKQHFIHILLHLFLTLRYISYYYYLNKSIAYCDNNWYDSCKRKDWDKVSENIYTCSSDLIFIVHFIQCQATWLYLEPIFSSEDILAQMPEEGRKFGIVDSYWRDIMTEAIKDTHCLVATDQPNMLSRFRDANVLLEEIQKGLNAYLEKKRLYFPR